MANIFFIKPCLAALEEGRSVRFGIFLLMWIIAFVVVIGGIVSWIDFWNHISGQNAAGIIGVVLYQLVFLILLYFLFQILVIRASNVLNAEAYETEFTMLPVMSVLTRAAGEFLAVFFVFQGIGWLIYAWSSGAPPDISSLGSFENLFGLVSFMAGTGFKAGVLSLVRGIIWGFAAIVIAYFWAEAIILSLKWYMDIKKIRKISEGYEKPGAAESAPAAEVQK